MLVDGLQRTSSVCPCARSAIFICFKWPKDEPGPSNVAIGDPAHPDWL
jgi:hypothetical protein